MSYLIDSDWVADYLKGRAPAVALLDTLFPDGLAISIITYAEVYEGVYYGRERERHEAGFRGFLQAAHVLSLSRSVARRYAILRGQLQRDGQLLDQPDLLIAATALEHDLALVTRNTQHFARVPGLRMYRD